MLKMKGDPEMYMITKDRMTEWPKIIRAFVPGLRHFCRNGRKSSGHFGRLRTKQMMIGEKYGPQSAHRLIGSPAQRLSTE
jgi:hypothetical protein